MIHSKNHIREFLPGSLLIGFLVSIATANAQQDVFAPPPPSPVPALQPAGVHMFPDPSLDYPEPPESPYQWGSFVLKPHYLYRFLYGDGIQATPGHRSTTAINSFAPGFYLNMGSHWAIDYTPTWDLYSNSIFHDTVDEAANLAGAYSFNGWTVQFNQGYHYSSQPLIETGRQTSVQDFTTSIDLSNQLSRQVLSETILSQDLRSGVGFPASSEPSALEWLHYQFFPQLDTALGAGVGYINVSEGTDISYFRPQLQATFSPTSKLSFNLSGGLDRREFLVHPRSFLNTPIYSLTAQYAPFETTTLTLTGGREVSESFFANQSTKDTHWNATLKQRLLKHYLLVASIGQHDADYISNVSANSAGRDDRELASNVRLSSPFFRRGTFAVLYRWDRNTSNIHGFGFSSHQVGFEIGYKY